MTFFFQFLVLLDKSEQYREPLSALSLDCLCPARPTPCSCTKYSQKKTRNLSLLPAKTVAAKQGSLHGQVAVSRCRTVTPDPGLVNPESFMGASRSAGALDQFALKLVKAADFSRR